VNGVSRVENGAVVDDVVEGVAVVEASRAEHGAGEMVDVQRSNMTAGVGSAAAAAAAAVVTIPPRCHTMHYRALEQS